MWPSSKAKGITNEQCRNNELIVTAFRDVVEVNES